MTENPGSKEISVQICTGTTCYVMGASDLLTLEDYIPAHQTQFVKISGSTCLGLCRENRLKPPFVKICGKIMAQATVARVLEAINVEFEGTNYAYNE